MKCYLVTGEQENTIMKVQEEDIASFKKEYQDRILLEGNSIQDLLIKLSDKLNSGKAGDMEPALFR